MVLGREDFDRGAIAQLYKHIQEKRASSEEGVVLEDDLAGKVDDAMALLVKALDELVEMQDVLANRPSAWRQREVKFQQENEEHRAEVRTLRQEVLALEAELETLRDSKQALQDLQGQLSEGRQAQRELQQELDLLKLQRNQVELRAAKAEELRPLCNQLREENEQLAREAQQLREQYQFLCSEIGLTQQQASSLALGTGIAQLRAHLAGVVAAGSHVPMPEQLVAVPDRPRCPVTGDQHQHEHSQRAVDADGNPIDDVTAASGTVQSQVGMNDGSAPASAAAVGADRRLMGERETAAGVDARAASAGDDSGLPHASIADSLAALEAAEAKGPVAPQAPSSRSAWWPPGDAPSDAAGPPADGQESWGSMPAANGLPQPGRGSIRPAGLGAEAGEADSGSEPRSTAQPPVTAADGQGAASSSSQEVGNGVAMDRFSLQDGHGSWMHSDAAVPRSEGSGPPAAARAPAVMEGDALAVNAAVPEAATCREPKPHDAGGKPAAGPPDGGGASLGPARALQRQQREQSPRSSTAEPAQESDSAASTEARSPGAAAAAAWPAAADFAAGKAAAKGGRGGNEEMYELSSDGDAAGSDSDGDDLPEMRALPRISTGEKQAWLEDGPSDASGVAAGSTPLALTVEEEAMLGQLPEPGSSQLRERLQAARLRSLTLETQLEMHLSQVGKLQEQLESMDRDKAVLEATLTRHIRETDAKPASLLGRWSTKPAATEHRIKSLSDALKVVEEENTLLKARLLSVARTSPDLADDLRAHDLVRARARLDAEPPASSAQASSEAAAAPAAAEPVEIRRARQVREENSWLMASLVSIKVENAELKGDHQRVKRSLVRAKETEKALREEIEELKLQLERLGQPPPPSGPSSRLFPGHHRSGAASRRNLEQPEDEVDTLDWTDLGSSTPPSHPALSSPDTSPLASRSASLHLT